LECGGSTPLYEFTLRLRLEAHQEVMLCAVVFESIREGEAPAEPPPEFGSAGASPSRSEGLILERLTNAWRYRNTNPKRKRGII